MTRWHRDAEALPAAPGSYRLAIALPDGAPLPPRLATRVGCAALPAGWVVYAGSARGPGGLRARVRRHLRRDKTLRWHVDWLTTAPGAVTLVQACPARSECGLTAEALAIDGAWCPVPGFGASDCACCPAHLIAVPGAPMVLLPGQPV